MWKRGFFVFWSGPQNPTKSLSAHRRPQKSIFRSESCRIGAEKKGSRNFPERPPPKAWFSAKKFEDNGHIEGEAAFFLFFFQKEIFYLERPDPPTSPQFRPCDAPTGRNMTSMTKPRLGDLLRGTPRTFSYLDGTHDVCRVFFLCFLFFGLDHNIPQNP